jgi:cytidylate kinase
MKPVVLCLSGGIASGKTTLASALAERFTIPHASFGRFVREVARERGLPEHREQLQQLGESLIEELGWDAFCTKVLETGGWTTGHSVVIDGIRHVAAFEAVGRLVAPVPARLVFVEVGVTLRQHRIDEGGSLEGTELAKAESHSTEKDVHVGLRARTDRVLDGTKSVSEIVEEVAAWCLVV